MNNQELEKLLNEAILNEGLASNLLVKGKELLGLKKKDEYEIPAKIWDAAYDIIIGYINALPSGDAIKGIILGLNKIGKGDSQTERAMQKIKIDLTQGKFKDISQSINNQALAAVKRIRMSRNTTIKREFEEKLGQVLFGD